jgi:hypothetical protein
MSVGPSDRADQPPANTALGDVHASVAIDGQTALAGGLAARINGITLGSETLIQEGKRPRFEPIARPKVRHSGGFPTRFPACRRDGPGV